MEPTKPRSLSTRSASANALSAPGAGDAAQSGANGGQARQSAVPAARPTTRSQTMAMARQQVAGPSMSSLLQSRSEAAVSKQQQAQPAAQPVPAAPPRSPLPGIDNASDLSNPLAATEYVNDIYSYFRRVEPRYRVQAGYMARCQVRLASRVILLPTRRVFERSRDRVRGVRGRRGDAQRLVPSRT